MPRMKAKLKKSVRTLSRARAREIRKAGGQKGWRKHLNGIIRQTVREEKRGTKRQSS